MADRVVLALETITAALTEQALQSLEFRQILFGESGIDVDHIGPTVQSSSEVDLLALLITEFILFGTNQLVQYVLP